ncbi:MAG: hypothetical protein EP330_05040 [Deltaproteobacteria bacterium]|nr:MAG: hypothetical protein EP330_05040 [Deltaproteobacteria bacterium]
MTTRVLFLHGLEGHPNGSKVRYLRKQGFEVEAPDMGMGMFVWGRRHSVLRSLLRLHEVRGALLIAVLGVLAVPWNPLALCATVVSLGALVSRRDHLFAAALSRSFDDCVRVAAEAASRSEADVLVGSSWGGAVAAELLASGRWTKPALLLAPAMGRVHRRARRKDAAERIQGLALAASQLPVRVVHDPVDDVVPFADSVMLAAQTPVALVAVEGGGHRLLEFVHGGGIDEAIGELIA